MTQMTKEEIIVLGHAFFDGKTLQFYAEDQWCDWITKDSIRFGMYANWRIKPDGPKKITISYLRHDYGRMRMAVFESYEFNELVADGYIHIKSLDQVVEVE